MEPRRTYRIRAKTLLFLVVILLVALPLAALYIRFALSSTTWVRHTESKLLAGNPFPQYDRDSAGDIYRIETDNLALKNHVTLANSDSTYLVIDLRDSTLWLGFKGLTLYNARPAEISISPALNKLDKRALLQWLSSPLQSEVRHASFARQQAILQNAPRDTAEAARIKHIYKAEEDFASILVSFDNGLLLVLEQNDISSARQRFQRLAFRRRLFRQILLPDLLNGLAFRKIDYHPMIRMKMERQQIVNIYRALPVQFQTSLSMP